MSCKIKVNNVGSKKKKNTPFVRQIKTSEMLSVKKIQKHAKHEKS